MEPQAPPEDGEEEEEPPDEEVDLPELLPEEDEAILTKLVFTAVSIIVVKLIGHTRTKTGLKIQAALDTNAYATGKKVDKEALAALNIERPDDQNSQWNYIIRPHVNTDHPEVVG